MNNYCIYKHTSPSGKSYIGQTKDLDKREMLHKSEHSNCTFFHRAIIKYGWDNFKHEIIENNLTLDQANEKEQSYIIAFNTLSPNGYNLTTGGLNRKVSKETVLKISMANTGRKRSIETKQKISAALSGKPKTKEHIKKIIESRSSYRPTDYTKKLIRDFHIGKPKTEEHKRKISASRKGQRPTRESIEKSLATRKMLKQQNCGIAP